MTPTNINLADYTYLMFTAADDAPEAVSDLYEQLVGYKRPDDCPCFTLTSFDDTHIVAVPRTYELPVDLSAMIDDHEEHQEYLQESN